MAQAGGYLVTQLAITNATHPSINNPGEVVWAVQNGVGIYSSVRGQLSATGVSPHLANSGEVVYADSFGGAYDRTQFLAERKKMMQAWADYLDVLREQRKVVAGKFGRVA